MIVCFLPSSAQDPAKLADLALILKNPAMEDDQNKWKTNQSTKINLIGCDTIVNSPSFMLKWSYLFMLIYIYFTHSNYLSLIPTPSHLENLYWKKWNVVIDKQKLLKY